MKRYFVRSIIDDKETGITVEKIVGKEHSYLKCIKISIF